MTTVRDKQTTKGNTRKRVRTQNIVPRAERKQQTETERAELRTPRVNRVRKETRPT